MASNKEWRLVKVSSTAGTSSQQIEPFNWNLCILCQQDTGEALQCPAKSKRKDCGAGYHTLEQDLRRFDEIGVLPKSIRLDCLDDGTGISSTLSHNQACWHKSCRDQYNKTKLSRCQKRKVEEEASVVSKHTRSSTPLPMQHEDCTEEAICFFCDKVSPINKLTPASTMDMDTNVRSAALKLNDSSLLTKLSAAARDLPALEAKYHKTCLTSLYNRVRALERKELRENTEPETMVHSLVFAELLDYIEDTHRSGKSVQVFQLSDLMKLYCQRLEQLGVSNYKLHATRFKEKLVTHIPGLTAHKKGKHILLAFEDDVGEAIGSACWYSNDADAICLAKAARIIRKDLFSVGNSFCGTFSPDCQEQSVPESLLALVNMILQGPNIEEQFENGRNQAALSISQIIKFNSNKRQKKDTVARSTRHNRQQEAPVPLYLALSIHSQTRSRSLIDKLHALGLCISYDRMLVLSSEVASRVCDHFKEIGAVCPPHLKKGIFTTAACDNIDHNPSSRTSAESFHGTGISLIQHPDKDFLWIDNTISLSNTSTCKTIPPLPDYYTNVPPVAELPKNYVAPPTSVDMKESTDKFLSARDEGLSWLKHIDEKVNKSVSSNIPVAWGAYNALNHPIPKQGICVSSLLPLFPDVAHSPSMIKHAMDMSMKAINHLNPHQVPVITFDQPLFAIAKQVQWQYPDTHGEDHCVIVLGGLHIELASLKAIGHLLEGSGWSEAISLADVATPGTAESFIHSSHITRTRYSHQVTVAALYILQKRAYEKLVKNQTEISFDDWCDSRSADIPSFFYWNLVMEFELTILTFISSIRTGNFQLYLESLSQLSYWFFIFDHVNYARWVPIHIRDMKELSLKHPDILAQFLEGKFTVQKTDHSFSAMAIDQAHEQNNDLVKGEGGAIGLTSNSNALNRWMVAGPEVAQIVQSFERCCLKRRNPTTQHHDQSQAEEIRFTKHVMSLVETIDSDQLGNPFEEESKDILHLVNNKILDESVTEVVRNLQSKGKEQYETFVKERIMERCMKLNEVIPQNRTMIFKQPTVKNKSKDKLKLAEVMSDCELFAKLCISCQTRDGDIDEFFAHENHAYPPSLSSNGDLNHGTKSDVVSCLEKLSNSTPCTVPDVTALIIDGAAVVQMMKPSRVKTFKDYAEFVFVPYIRSQLDKVSRIDIVWGRYYL